MEGGFRDSRRQSHIQEILTLLPTRPKLLVTCSPSQLSVCPLRTAGSLQTSLHLLQGLAQGSTSSVETRLVLVLDSGQSPVSLIGTRGPYNL